MYDTATFLFNLLILGCIAALAIYGYNWWQSRAPERARAFTQRRFAAAPVVHDPEEQEARESNKATMKAMGMPTVDAGRIIQNVPAFDPDKEGGFTLNLEVVTSSRIRALSPSGPKSIDFLELAKDYAIFLKGGKAFVLRAHRLTEDEEKYLTDQRVSLIERKDNKIEDLWGDVWTIKGAMGDYAGQKSTIQVLTVSKNCGEPGMISAFPPDLLDCRSHVYYDIQAVNDDTSDVMVAIYTADSWCCYIGRQMTDVEIAALQGI